MRERDIFISVVLRVRDAEGFLTDALDRLVAVMEASFDYYEILIVDDASVDATRARIAAVQARARNIQLYALARRKGDNIALTAGLDHAIGDMVVLMDPRLDPPELIPQMVERALGGVEIVYGLPRERLTSRPQSLLMRGFVASLAHLNNVDVPLAMSSFRLLNRNVLNYMLEAVDRHRSLMFLPALSGYPYDTIQYDRIVRPGHVPKRDTSGRIAKAMDLLFSTSARPLRIITLMSLSISVLAFLYAVYVLLIIVVKDDIANGWASMSLQISGLFFLVCIILAVMSEYILQILEATTHHPRYHIRSQQHSGMMQIARDRNVIETRAMEPSPRLETTEPHPAQ